MKDLQEEAADAIDTTWKCSWHWKRHGEILTLEGWKRAEQDARRAIANCNERLRALKIVLPKIQEQVKAMEQ